MKLSPYIMFPGNAEEALKFYEKCLHGEIKYLGRFKDFPMESPEEYKDKVMHASFYFGENLIMACDNIPGETPLGDSNIQLSMDVPDIVELEVVFNKLANEGKVTMPLQDTHWGARFGMLTDKFGIKWMFSHENEKKDSADS